MMLATNVSFSSSPFSSLALAYNGDHAVTLQTSYEHVDMYRYSTSSPSRVPSLIACSMVLVARNEENRSHGKRM